MQKRIKNNRFRNIWVEKNFSWKTTLLKQFSGSQIVVEFIPQPHKYKRKVDEIINRDINAPQKFTSAELLDRQYEQRASRKKEKGEFGSSLFETNKKKGDFSRKPVKPVFGRIWGSILVWVRLPLYPMYKLCFCSIIKNAHEDDERPRRLEPEIQFFFFPFPRNTTCLVVLYITLKSNCERILKG